jgi:ParB-like chromosome segregation protein Spo0J
MNTNPTVVPTVDINLLTPDPNQPRKLFDPIRLQGLAKTIKTEGIINPIEIDEDMMIITGERRWRAAKEAGFTEVPYKIISIDKDKRSLRQLIENIQNDTMTSMETARALFKELVKMGWKPSQRRLIGQTISDDHDETGKWEGDKYVIQLSEKIGKSKQYIYDHLNLLKERPEVMEWLDKPKSSYSLIRDAGKAPDKYKEQLKDRIIEGKIDSYDAVVEMTQAMKREPEHAPELLKLDLSGKTQADAVQEIRHIVPKEVEPLEEMQHGSFIIQTLLRLIKLIIKTLPGKIIQTDRVRILQLRDELNEVLKKYELNAALEGEVV